MFNYRLARAQRVVVSAFGICASQFRILDKAIKSNVDTGVEIAKSRYLRRNIIIDIECYCCLYPRWSQRDRLFLPPDMRDQEAAHKQAWSSPPLSKTPALHARSLLAATLGSPNLHACVWLLMCVGGKRACTLVAGTRDRQFLFIFKFVPYIRRQESTGRLSVL